MAHANADSPSPSFRRGWQPSRPDYQPLRWHPVTLDQAWGGWTELEAVPHGGDLAGAAQIQDALRTWRQKARWLRRAYDALDLSEDIPGHWDSDDDGHGWKARLVSPDIAARRFYDRMQSLIGTDWGCWTMRVCSRDLHSLGLDRNDPPVSVEKVLVDPGMQAQLDGWWIKDRPRAYGPEVGQEHDLTNKTLRLGRGGDPLPPITLPVVVLQPDPVTHDRSTYRSIRDRLADRSDPDPFTAKDVMAKTGRSRKTVQRWIAEDVAAGLVERTAYGQYRKKP